MSFPVRLEWSTASVGSSHAPTDAVDHSAPSAIRPESTYISGKVVQTNGATSVVADAAQYIVQIVAGYKQSPVVHGSNGDQRWQRAQPMTITSQGTVRLAAVLELRQRNTYQNVVVLRENCFGTRARRPA